MQEYLFRATTNRLLEHRKSIEESGDTIVSQDFQGGRDWLLTCRKGSLSPTDPTDGVVPRSSLLQGLELVLGRPAGNARSVLFSVDRVVVTEFAVKDGARVLSGDQPVLVTSTYAVVD